MKKIIITTLVSFILGYGVCFYLHKTKTVTITKTEIQTNTITRNIKDMSCEEAKADLECYYISNPFLDIEHISNNDFLLSAQLCEREWKREVKITMPSKQYRNMIVAGIVISANKKHELGGYSQYYRLFGRFGLGGGVSVLSNSVQLYTGGIFLW